MRDQLVEARVAEGVVLHLAHRPQAGHAEPDRGAEDPGLRERRVDAAVGAEAVAQAGRRAEDAAGAPDVLAHDQHVVVALQLDVEASLTASTRSSSATEDPPQLREVVRERRRRVDERVLEEQAGIGRRLRLGGAIPARITSAASA